MTVVSRDGAVNLAESNMRIFVMARIHKPQRCQRTMSGCTRISNQLGRAGKPHIESVNMVCCTTEKAGKQRGCRQSDSRIVSVKPQKCGGGKSRKSRISRLSYVKQYRRGNIICTQR